MNIFRNPHAFLYFLILTLPLGVYNTISSQGSITAQERLQIDSLFLEFEEMTGPGLSFGLLRDGEIIYSRNIGMADIENNIPITSQTSFQLGDLSRHFTAYAALLLEREGQLNLQSSVASYLPELKIPRSIKVIHLLQHSTGLHEFHTIKTLAGWYHERPYNQSDILNIIQLQEHLQFDPGTDFNYSETNLILLKEVIEATSGKDLNSFMKEQVFGPLGMDDTAYKNDSLPLPNVAKGYELEDDAHKHIKLHNHTLGIHNLYSSVEDMLKWEWNMMHPKSKDIKLFRQLKSVIQLDSGREFSIPQGQLMQGQHFTHKERGITSDYLTARIGPYTTAMFNFPDHNLVGVVLGNNNAPYNGYLVMLSAYILLEKEFTAPRVAFINTQNAPSLTSDQLSQYTGTYYDEEYALIRRVELKNDTLQYIRPNISETPLIPIGKDKFQAQVGGDDIIIVNFVNEDDKYRIDYIVGEAEAIPLIRYQPTILEASELDQYTGTYFSKSLGIAYHVERIENRIVATNPINGSSNLTSVTPDLFTSDHYFMRSLFFNRNPEDQVDGFLVRHFSAWDVWFEKV